MTPSPAHGLLVADKIRQAKATVEGERKQVTVLFADVTSSMDLAGPLDPEAWSQMMQRFFRIFCDAIERFEGFVDKFTGDGTRRHRSGVPSIDATRCSARSRADSISARRMTQSVASRAAARASCTRASL